MTNGLMTDCITVVLSNIMETQGTKSRLFYTEQDKMKINIKYINIIQQKQTPAQCH